MDNDMSWLGLYKRGIKLQYTIRRNFGSYDWVDIDSVYIVASVLKFNEKYKIRYKHSIQ